MDLYRDFSYVRLTAPAAVNDLEFSVDETSRLPSNADLSSKDFYMTLPGTLGGSHEVVRVTAKSTTSGPGVITVARGVDGTSAGSWSSGSLLKHVLTSSMLSRASVPAGGAAAQVLMKDTSTDYDASWGTITIPQPKDYLSTNPWTSIDEFEGASLDPAWVRVDSGTGASRVSWTQAAGQLTLKQEGGDAASELHALLRPIGTDIAAGEALVTRITIVGPPSNYTMGGLIISNGTTYGSGSQVITLNYITGGLGANNDCRLFTNFNSNPTTSSGGFQVPSGRPYWLRLSRPSGNLYRMDLSPNGVQWISSGTVDRGTWTPTHFGFIASSWGSSNKGVVTYDCFRRMSGVT